MENVANIMKYNYSGEPQRRSLQIPHLDGHLTSLKDKVKLLSIHGHLYAQDHRFNNNCLIVCVLRLK